MTLTLSLFQLSKILKTDPFYIHTIDLTTSITGITTDTRNLKPGELFVALEGEKFDGHNFAPTAIAKGAVALIVSRQLSLNSARTIPQLIVPDTLQAYQTIARWWRDRFTIPVIGITGSVGKTTTKELIAALLSFRGRVLKTQANYNNEIGVPKTLLELDQEDDYAVIEMAMRAAGEIALLTEITQPTIGVITNVGTAHIGRLGSIEAIARAKCELLARMPGSSIAVLNHDNQLLMDTAATVWQGETITYGLQGGDVRGELIDPNTLRIEGKNFPLPLSGCHNAINYLAAIAVAKVLEIDITPLTEGLTVELPQGRSRRYALPDDIVILDETYNAGLESMLASLQLLKETPGKRHIAVLGTMKELGEHSAQFHYQVGEKVKQLDIDRLFVLVDEPETEAIAAGAGGIATECFSDREDLLNSLQEVVRQGDRLLFKASNSVGLNRVVEQFRSQF
ncbi:UDP-N-acetylmuramoyl-tripeptide--D-alanyl-D-alanine ligase [Pleurocapsales cyanobacterium LEGE 06147]|nr:UDP-N-acetylmuramoyl-tripeptide--D-alanyl-D-alanine ligase [Pleurocapsales cyanobacterium LEGE 06147]